DAADDSTDSVCVQGLTDLSIAKTGTPPTQDVLAGTPFIDITWTVTVRNNGPLVDTNVTVSDVIPAGTLLVSATPSQGTCTGGAVVTCVLGTLQADHEATITLVTTPTVEGQLTNNAHVSGALAETDTTNNDASASVFVATHHKPPVFCTAVVVRP